MHKPDATETTARGSVRFHCKSLSLTNAQEAACIATVSRLIAEGESTAAAIGVAKQEAERYARPAMRRLVPQLHPQH